MPTHRELGSPTALPGQTQSAAWAARGKAETAGTAYEAGIVLASLSYPGMEGSVPHICSGSYALPQQRCRWRVQGHL